MKTKETHHLSENYDANAPTLKTSVSVSYGTSIATKNVAMLSVLQLKRKFNMIAIYLIHAEEYC